MLVYIWMLNYGGHLVELSSDLALPPWTRGGPTNETFLRGSTGGCCFLGLPEQYVGLGLILLLGSYGERRDLFSWKGDLSFIPQTVLKVVWGNYLWPNKLVNHLTVPTLLNSRCLCTTLTSLGKKGRQ